MKHGTPGTGLAAMILRVVLGITFVWAGAGKLFVTLPYSGQAAADLANAGAPIVPAVGPAAPAEPSPAPSTPATGTPAPAGPASRPAPAPPTVLPPPTTPLPDPEDQPAPPAPPTRPTPLSSPTSPTALTLPAPGAAGRSRDALALAVLTLEAGSAAQGRSAPAAAAPAGTPAPGLVPVRAFVAEQFPTEVRVRRLYQIAAQVRQASLAPAPGAWRLLPAGVGLAPWPVRLAWAAGITELAAGVCLLAGFMSRLASLPLIGVMVMAVWLTQIGPAMQSGAVRLWVLPDRTWWDPAQWSTLLWQLALLAMLKAQLLLGSGTLSVDRVLFGGSRSGGKPPEPKMDA